MRPLDGTRLKRLGSELHWSRPVSLLWLWQWQEWHWSFMPPPTMLFFWVWTHVLLLCYHADLWTCHPSAHARGWICQRQSYPGVKGDTFPICHHFKESSHLCTFPIGENWALGQNFNIITLKGNTKQVRENKSHEQKTSVFVCLDFEPRGFQLTGQ